MYIYDAETPTLLLYKRTKEWVSRSCVLKECGAYTANSLHDGQMAGQAGVYDVANVDITSYANDRPVVHSKK